MPDTRVEGEVEDGPWVVRVVLTRRRQRWEVTELGVRPRGTTPPGGVTATALREIRLGQVVERVLASHAEKGAGKPPPLPADPLLRDLVTAYRYLTYVALGHPSPAQAVADEQHLKTHRTIYNRLLRLRQDGLLSKPGHGQPGGSLTPKGRRLLSKVGE